MIEDGWSTDIREYLNCFNKLPSKLIGVGVIIDDEDKKTFLLLLLSFLNSYHILVIELFVGKDTLIMKDAISTILKNKKLGMLSVGYEKIAYVVSDNHDWSACHSSNQNGRGTYKSNSRPMRYYSKYKYFYCHMKRDIKWTSKNMNDGLKKFNRIKMKKGRQF